MPDRQKVPAPDDLPQRFWEKVDKSLGGCWIWTGARNADYGQFWWRGRMIRAHRVVMGDPKGLCVLHRCDVPLCVNPDHLFVGTRADNNADRDAKGRHRVPSGAQHVHAKLTRELVRQIRYVYAQGRISQEALGKIFGVSRGAICCVLLRRVWKHVDDANE